MFRKLLCLLEIFTINTLQNKYWHIQAQNDIPLWPIQFTHVNFKYGIEIYQFATVTPTTDSRLHACHILG